MEFRPCIDIHNGMVKQIVGSSLQDQGNQAKDNFVSTKNARYYANLFRQYHLKGGHVIMLNSKDSSYYEDTKKQALEALEEYPGGLQIGGGITAENAKEYLQAGASHVIVTSYVFRDGKIHYDHMNQLVKTVGKEHIVLDLSCKKKEDGYYIVTDRWQNMTEEKVTLELLEHLSSYCDEFLIHAVDVEGKNKGIEVELVQLLGNWQGCPITYAGGVHDMKDIECLKLYGQDRMNYTVGSALDLYGGALSFKELVTGKYN